MIDADVGAVPDTQQAPPRDFARPRVRRITVALGMLLLVVLWASWRLPLQRALGPLPEPTLVLLDRDGDAFARRGAYKEKPVTVAELPKHLVDAVLSTEDRRFYQHAGIDLRGVARAAAANARAGEVQQGGSTITQQLAKTVFLSGDRTLRRKLQEAAIALWLEAQLGKDDILARYLSAIYFGDGVYGLRAAARHYFDKAPGELDLAESAMLAGMIKAPSKLAPTDNLDGARERARVVLAAMTDAEAITPSEAQRARARPARLRNGRADLPVGSYFADWVSPQAKQAFDAQYGELRVDTTLNSGLQRRAEQSLRGALRRHGGMQGAVVVLDRAGEVLALVGGRDYAKSQFNRATQAKRQPGSAFKLFVYLAALRDGMTPPSMVDDSPVTIGDWSPGNYDGSYAGRITLREAFARSSNVAAVRLTQEVGPRAVVRAARDLGIKSDLEADATIALGTHETTLMEITSAYAALAAGGTPVVVRGLPLAEDAEPVELEPLDPKHRAMLLDLLWSAVNEGTGRAARLRVPAFGKTGTTQDYRDAWFIGMAGDLVTGVWVGNDDSSPMNKVTGGGLPAQIWRDVMSGALSGRDRGDLMVARDVAAPPPPVREPTRRRSAEPEQRRSYSRSRGEGRGKGRGKGKGKKGKGKNGKG